MIAGKCSGAFAILLGSLIAAGCGDAQPTQSDKQASQRAVRIAAASDLKYALDEIIADFKTRHLDIDVTVTYGSSGNFHAQLENHAPFDMYMSADLKYPRLLIESQKASADSEFKYAIGQIVLWVPRSSSLAVEEDGVGILSDPKVRRIAIANPQHAPYGRAAEAALKSLGAYEAVKDKLVLGQNIAQTAHFVESGAAEVGVIALSLAKAPALAEKGVYWLFPLDAYPRMDQGGVILNWAQDRQAAELLRDFIVSETGRATLERYGFLMPGE